jgi:hypothetical protein
VLVLSASKQNALLLEGILVEAGLVHVSKDWSAEGAAGRPLPQLVVLDAQMPQREILEQILPRFKAAHVRPAWLLMGNEAEASALLPWIESDVQRLATPLNPLVFLKLAETLLSERGAGSPALQSAPLGVVRGV